MRKRRVPGFIRRQCSVITKNGRRCTRNITQMGYKCEQHSNQEFIAKLKKST